MLIIEKKLLLFKSKEIHFAEHPFDVDGCDFVKFADCRKEVDDEGFIREKSFTSITDLTEDLEILFDNFGKHNRKQIKRAEKEGIQIHLNRHYDEFNQMVTKFQKTKGFGTILDRVTENTKWMKKYSTLFTAEYEGEILCGTLYLEDENTIKGWLSGTTRLEATEQKAIIGRASRLVRWEAMKYAKEKGLSEFDWGGMWSDDEANQDERKKAINDFKSSFGGVIATRYEYTKVYSRRYKLAQALYQMVNNLSIKNTS